MSLLSDFMRDQLRLYHDTKADAWPSAHLAVKDCWELEDVLSVGLNMYDRLKKIGERHSNQERGRGVATDWPFAQQLAKAWQDWLEISVTYLPAICACERAGLSVENAEEFRQACRDVSLMALDTEKARRSIESLDSGGGQPMSKALDELRNRIR